MGDRPPAARDVQRVGVPADFLAFPSSPLPPPSSAPPPFVCFPFPVLACSPPPFVCFPSLAFVCPLALAFSLPCKVSPGTAVCWCTRVCNLAVTSEGLWTALWWSRVRALVSAVMTLEGLRDGPLVELYARPE